MVIFSLRAFVALFVLLSFSSVYAQTKVVVIPLFGDDTPAPIECPICDTAPAPIEYAIGDTGPAGGIVFHVTNGGLNGLEAAPIDQVKAFWGCNGTDIEGVANLGSASTVDPHSGAVITPLIAVTCGGAAAVAAAYVWPNGQSDGFLPNKEELDLLYDQKNIPSLVNSFASFFYWSSSEFGSSNAWGQVFVNSLQSTSNKESALAVRAVRAF